MIQNPYPTLLNRLNPMVSDSRGDPSTTILINGHSNKLSLSSFDPTDWWISQLSSEKLLFAVDGDLYRVKPSQCEENERLWAAQLQTEVYIPHYPHKVQWSSWKRGQNDAGGREWMSWKNSCAGLDSTGAHMNTETGCRNQTYTTRFKPAKIPAWLEAGLIKLSPPSGWGATGRKCLLVNGRESCFFWIIQSLRAYPCLYE